MQPADLALAGAVEQARLVRARVVSAREVIEATLAAIAANDSSLNAFRTALADQALADQAIAEATRLDELGASSTAPLAGVPVAIKDDTDVAGEVTA